MSTEKKAKMKIDLDAVELTEDELDDLFDACEIGFYYNELVEEEELRRPSYKK